MKKLIALLVLISFPVYAGTLVSKFSNGGALLPTDEVSILRPIGNGNFTNYNILASNFSSLSSPAWGSITGTISSQTDLQNVLNGKQPTITTGTTAQYLRGDLSLATFPATGVSSVFSRTGAVTAQSGDYTASQVGAEPALGNPALNGYVLSSTIGGTRSWVPAASGMTYPSTAGVPYYNGTTWGSNLALTTTGTSGAATLTGNTLNIPQYNGGGSGTVNSGTQYQLGYYGATGTAISGNSNIYTNSSGFLGVGTSSPNGTIDAETAVAANTGGTDAIFMDSVLNNQFPIIASHKTGSSSAANTYLGFNSYVNSAGILHQYNNTTGGFSINTDGRNAASAPNMVFTGISSGGTATTVATLFNGGGMGIGTSTQSGQLNVAPPANTTALTLSGNTDTASTNVLNILETWNNAATTFETFKINVTNTASNTASKLMNLVVSGSSVFSIDELGNVIANSFNGSGSGLTAASVPTAALSKFSQASLVANYSGLDMGGSTFGPGQYVVPGNIARVTKSNNFINKPQYFATISATPPNGLTTTSLNLNSGSGGLNLQVGGGTKISVTTVSNTFSNVVSAFTPTNVGTASHFTYTSPADTNITAGSDMPNIIFNDSSVRQWAVGTVALQEDIQIKAPTLAQTATGTFTEAATVSIQGAPIAGTNATITQSEALRIGGGTLALENGGTLPTVSSGSIATGSGTHKGVITGLTAATSVTVTFAAGQPLPAPQVCTMSGGSVLSGAYVSAISATAVTFTMTAFTGTLYYLCF